MGYVKATVELSGADIMKMNVVWSCGVCLLGLGWREKGAGKKSIAKISWSFMFAFGN